MTIIPKIINKNTGHLFSNQKREKVIVSRLDRKKSIKPSNGRIFLGGKVSEQKRKSGREDSNLRPYGPEPYALTRLRYAPIKDK